MPKTKIIQLIRNREQLIKSVPDELIKNMERIQNDLYREMLYAVKELDVKNKKILNNAFNLRRAARLRQMNIQWLKKYGYYEDIRGFGKKYNLLIQEAEKYYAELGYNSKFLQRDLDILTEIKKKDIQFLINQDKNINNLLYNTFTDSIYGKSNWSTLAERLKLMVVGDDKVNGLLKKYGATYANSSFAAFDRRIQNIKADQYNIDLFLFSGAKLKATRAWCASRKDKVFTRNEIDSWNSQTWPGKAAGRDVWVFLGGWNCVDILTPITEELARAEFGYG